MATTTVGTEFAIMHVVGTVAVSATAVDAFHFVERYSVTVIASDVDVSPFKRKLRLRVVIERPNGPGNRIVAGIAAIQEIALMRVIIIVA